MISLTVWGNVQIKYLFDPATGSLQIAKRKKDEYGLDGFASREPVFGVLRRLYAVYPYLGRLYFKAGKKTWDITDVKVECRFWWLFFGVFTGLIIKLDGRIVHHAMLIHPTRAFMAIIDPTYDNLDAESDHFFLFLRKQLPRKNWRDWILNGRETDTPRQIRSADTEKSRY